MAGRKPKPTAVKELEGNPGKRKLNTFHSGYTGGLAGRIQYLFHLSGIAGTD